MKYSRKSIEEIEEDLTDKATKLLRHMKQGGHVRFSNSTTLYKYSEWYGLVFQPKVLDSWKHDYGMASTEAELLEWLELSPHLEAVDIL